MFYMDKELQEKGWALDTHKLPKKILDELVEKKDEFLNTSCEEVQKAFGVTFSKFDEEKIESIELAKAIARAFLRYDNHSHLLAQAIWKELKDNFHLADQAKYLALPYPIIHFSMDTSEAGGKHKDAYEYIEHFYTTWTPLNDCLHKPLAITENTHLKDSFVVRQLRLRLKSIDKFIFPAKKTLKPDILLGQFLVWHGTTEHEGLLNTSDEAKVALVVRFTSSPILSESTIPVEKIEKYVSTENNIFSRELVQKIIACFKEVEKESPKKMDTAAVRSHIKSWSMTAEELKRLGYVLGLWAQRLDGKKDVSLFYLYSFFCGTDNYYFLKKYVRHAIANFTKKDVENFIHSILSEFGNEQLIFVTKESIRMGGEKGKNLHITYPEKVPLLYSIFS